MPHNTDNEKSVTERLATVISQLSTKDLAESLLRLPEKKLLALMLRLLPVLGKESLYELKEKSEASIEQVEADELINICHYIIVYRKVQDRYYYAYLSHDSQATQRCLSRIYFLPGFIYQSASGSCIKVLRFHIDQNLAKAQFNEGINDFLVDFQHLPGDSKVLKTHTVKHSELVEEFSPEKFQETTNPPRLMKSLLIPSEYQKRVEGTLTQWISLINELKNTDGGGWTLQRNNKGDKSLTLATLQAKPLLIFNRKTGEIALCISPQSFINLLDSLMEKVVAKDNGWSAESAQMIRAKVHRLSDLTSEASVIEVLFDVPMQGQGNY